MPKYELVIKPIIPLLSFDQLLNEYHILFIKTDLIGLIAILNYLVLFLYFLTRLCENEKDISIKIEKMTVRNLAVRISPWGHTQWFHKSKFWL